MAGAGLLGVPSAASATAQLQQPLVLITLENTEYSQIVGSSVANYLNCGGKYAAATATPGFICQGTLFGKYYSAQHPSLPNYLDLTSGGDNGCLDDNCLSAVGFSGFSAPSLFGQMNNAHISSKSLEEGMPTNCDTSNRSSGGDTSVGGYVVRHNPELYFQDAASVCPYDDIAIPNAFDNLSSPPADPWPNPLPSFSLVTPNLCHDGHGLIVSGAQTCTASIGPAQDCRPTIGQALLICNADNWLAVNVSALLSQNPRPTVLITFDEGKLAVCGDGAHACGGHVMAAMVGPGVAAGVVDTSGPYSHFSLLRGVEGFLGLPCQQAACAAAPIRIPQTTADISLANPPGSMFVTAVSSGTVGLTWGAATPNATDPEPIAGYEVDRSADGGTSWTPMGPAGTPIPAVPANSGPAVPPGIVSSGTNSYADSSVVAGAYVYRVRTVDPEGEVSGDDHAFSGPSTSATVLSPPTACPQPSATVVLVQCASSHQMSSTASLLLNPTQAGHLLVAVIGAGGPATTKFCVGIKSVPAQWSPVVSSPSLCASPNFNATMYELPSTAAQTPCPTPLPCKKLSFPLTAPEDWTMWVGEYSGVATSAPADVSTTNDSAFLADSLMGTATSGPTTQAGDLAVAALWNDGSLPGLAPTFVTGTDPGAWSEIAVAAQGGGGWMEVLQKMVPGAGSAVGAQDQLTSSAKVRGIAAAFKTG